MFKPTPNPPENPDHALRAAAERAIHRHLYPACDTPAPPLFSVSPHQDTETLLVNASETFASVNALSSHLAFELQGSSRGVVLAIQQMSELGQLLLDRALEQTRPSA